MCVELFSIRAGMSGPLPPFNFGCAGVSRCSQRALLASPPECISSSQPRILETLRFSGHFQHTRAVSPAILSICGLQGVELGSKCSVNHEHTPSRGTVCQDNSPGQIGSPLPPRGSLRTQTRVRQAPPRTGQPRHQQLAGLVLLLPTRIPEMRPGGAPQ